jgi:hypothetical protein
MHLKGLDGYLHADSLDDFLNTLSQEIDEGLHDYRAEETELRFAWAMSTAYFVFGENAFRKWPRDSDRKFPLNKAIFEALGSVLCNVDHERVRANKDKIVENYRKLCTEDETFIRSVSQSTADPVHVVERYTKLSQLVS